MKPYKLLLAMCIFTWLAISTTRCQDQGLKWIGPSAGQRLAQEGVDTTSLAHLRAILRDDSNSLQWTVLQFLAERPMSQLAEDIGRFLLHRDRYLRFASAAALLEFGDERGSSYLDSVIRSPWEGDRVGLDTKFKAISLFAQHGSYEYSAILLSTYSTAVQVTDVGGYSLPAMLSYAARSEHRLSVATIVIDSYSIANMQNRNSVLYLLHSVDAPEADDFLLTILKTDTSIEMRSLALSYLAERPTSSFENYVFTAVGSETNSRLKKELCNYVRDVGTADAINLLQRVWTTEQDEDIRWSLKFWLDTFEPKSPQPGRGIAELLGELVATKHKCAAFAWLADANFVKELDNGLDNAKKHLVRGDSVNTYKEVQTFQDKVNKEYEKTVDNEKKGKPRDKRFVTVEGWKFLYYNAQYIMDRLPSGKK